MPKKVDSCVSSLLKEWEKDPASRPKAKKKDQTAKDQAWAICSAAGKRSAKAEANALAIMLEDGLGTTFIGAGATNRPFIPELEETRVEGEGDDKKLIVHLANPGKFYHWTGPFVLNRPVFANMIHNFESGVIGQKSAYDARHLPDRGALGWFERLFIDDTGRFFGEVDPTPTGLEAIENREFLYSSMEFHKNYERVDAVLDLEEASTEPCADRTALEGALEQYRLEAEAEEDSEDDMPEKLELQLQEMQDRLTALEAERDDAASERDDLRVRLEGAQSDVERERERATQLEQDALNTSIDAVVSLAQNHRDEEGRGHAKALIEWLGKVLRFEDFGEGDEVVQLSDDERPSIGLRHYLLSAARDLVTSLPGVVPAQRETTGGDEDLGGDDGEDFDFSAIHKRSSEIEEE
jgi:hypothetical protein